MPRVLHVTPTLDAAAGGPPVVVRSLASHAPENGFYAGILTTGASGTGEPGIACLPSQWAILGPAGRRTVREAIADADVVHLHTMWSPLVGLSAAEARRSGTPAVLSPHGMLDPWSLAQKAWKKRSYLALVERRVIKGVDHVLFTTRAEQENATAGFPIPASSVIALGADRPPRPLPTLAGAFLAHHPELVDRPLLIFLGRLHAKKRPEAAIAAMARMRESVPDAVLLMVGTGEPETVAELKALVSRLGLRNAVRFLGHLDGEAKWRALAASSLFLLPSQQENFAIAAAEALHAGVPVILTRDVAIWPEVTKAGAGIVVRPKASGEGIEDALARAAILLLSDPDAHGRASAAARALASQAYTWEASAAATHGLYRTLLADRQPVDDGGALIAPQQNIRVV